MKRKLRYLIALSVILSILAGCSKDEMESLSKSDVNEVNGKYHAEFHLPGLWISSDVTTIISLQFFPLDGRSKPYVYDAKLVNDGTHHISFVIDPDKNEDLPSGEYILRGVNPDGKKYVSRMRVKVEGRRVHFLEVAPHMVGFANGAGTPDSPYEIASKENFIELLGMLHNDPSYGRDLYFKQTDNITLDGSEGLIDENGWFSEPFAGNYDGGGYTVSGIYYQGSGDCIGLFRELRTGTIISNLTINISSIRSKGNMIGGVAGRTSGSATIKDCKIMGYIEGNDYVGGLIGYVDTNHQIYIDNVELSVTIADSHDKVGGLIGYSNMDSHVTISNITTNSAAFEIGGNDYVGGLIGQAYLTYLKINNVELVHSIYEATDIVTIGGNSYVGGLMGSFVDKGYSSGYRPGIETEEWWRELRVENSTVCCPIKATGTRVGGIAGEIYGLYGNEVAKFNNVMASAAVSGSDNVGGFIGMNVTCKCDFNNCSVKASNISLVEVKGRNIVGGFIGYGGSGATYSNIGISTNVTGTGSSVGGAFGLSRSNIHLENFKFTASMKVTGVDSVGGVSGTHIGHIYGNSDISFTYGQQVIPKASDISDFSVIVNGRNQVGGLVGRLVQPGPVAEIKGVFCRSEVRGNSSVGGLVGFMGLGTAIRNSAFGGLIEATGENCGGILGKLDGSVVEYCINYSTVKGSLDTGGLIGYMTGGDSYFPLVNYSVNVGSVNGAGRVGGVVGLIRVQDDNLHDIVTNCANFGTVNCNDHSTGEVEAFGGIVGASDEAGARVVGCANHGNVHGNLAAHGGGGIAGSMGNDPGDLFDAKDAYNFVISNCINTGDISNDNGSCHLGGILGYAEEGDDEYRPDAAVLGCLNRGDITSSQEYTSGGIVGQLDWYGHIEYCSCIPTLSSGSNLWEGTVKYDAWTFESYRVENNATYENADASHYNSLSTTYWELPSGSGYPTLKNSPFQDTVYDAE